MAGRGPAPKDPSKRRRRNVDPPPALQVAEPDGELHGPELTDGFPWPAPTRAWWDNWRRSPQAAGMTSTDWDFLMDTAVLHARFWTGDTSVAGELRLRVAKFGATPEDRQRLRIQLGDPKPAAASDVKPKASRYSHLRIAE